MMIHYHTFLFIVLPSFVLYSVEMKPGARNKRILYGHKAKDKNRDAYQSFRYYVYLAKAPLGEIDEYPKEVSSFWSYLQKFFSPRGASLDYLDCGGSLLTPNVVQTACHCLALYTKRSKDNNFTYAWPMNVWEDRIYAYVGSNHVSKMYDILVPKHYVVYQQCRAIFYHLQFNLMDYGLIITKDSIDKKAPKAAISYVPAYRANDILELYYKTIQKEFMCLVIGHGNWDVPYLVDFQPFIEDLASEYQLWGWRTAMNYVDCLSASYPPQDRIETRAKNIFFNYTADGSWVCFQAFKKWKKWNYLFGAGDSGGPVTCNSAYFAVASMAVDWLSMGAPIAHTSFENSAEYRADFLRWCTEFGGLDPDIPYEHVTDKNYIPTPPPIDVNPLSQCSLVTIHQQLLILPTTLIIHSIAIAVSSNS